MGFRRPESVLVLVYTDTNSGINCSTDSDINSSTTRSNSGDTSNGTGTDVTTTDVLLLKRLKPKAFWQSVTGSLEAHETPADAARRELQEETGLCDVPIVDCQHSNVFVISEAWRDRYAPGVTHNTEHVFCCRLQERPISVRLAPDEHSEFQWVPVDQAITIVSSWTNRQALERFVATAP